MLVKLNRFLTTAEVQEKYGIPHALALKILPSLPYVYEEPDGTRIHLESEVDEFLAEFVRSLRRAEARQSPAPSGTPGRKPVTFEIAAFANDLRQQDKSWKEVLSACKKRWPGDERVGNVEQVRATWRRHFGSNREKADSSAIQIESTLRNSV